MSKSNGVTENYLKVLPTNTEGGRRQTQSARLDLIPAEGLLAEGEAYATGEKKYGRLDSDPAKPNWRGLDISSEQSPLSHAIKHLLLYAAGDNSEDHLGHARANLSMLCWFRDNPQSRWYKMSYPQILAQGVSKPENPVALKELERRQKATSDPQTPMETIEDWSNPPHKPENPTPLPQKIVDPTYPPGSPGRHYSS